MSKTEVLRSYWCKISREVASEMINEVAVGNDKMQREDVHQEVRCMWYLAEAVVLRDVDGMRRKVRR
jgi:hypothetical protein